MNEEINKIINWIEMSYTRLNYKEELLLVNYIKQLQQENARLKDKLTEIKKVIDGYMPNEHAMCKAFDEIEFIIKEN